MTPSDCILEALQRLHHLRRRRFVGACAVVVPTVLVMCAALACLAAQTGFFVIGMGLARGALCGSAGTMVIAPWALWWRRRAPGATDLRRAVRSAEALLPKLGSGLTSAASLGELGQALGQGPPSAEMSAHSTALVAAHLCAVTAAMRAANLPARWDAQQALRRRRLRRLAGVMIAAGVAVILWAHEGRSRLLAALGAPMPPEVLAETLLTDVQVTYIYPHYTQLPPREVSGSDGQLEAVVGSTATLLLRTREPVHAAWLQLDPSQAQDSPTCRAAVGADGSLQMRVPIQQDANYRIVWQRRDGTHAQEPQAHTLHAMADRAPQVDMLTPAADVVLHHGRSVSVGWRAVDDFGLAQVALVVEPPHGPPERTVLWQDTGADPPGLRAEGHMTWSTAPLRLQPGETARICLVATDRDDVNGPHSHVSRTRRVSVFSPRTHHEEVMAILRKTLDALVDALGFELQAPLAPALLAKSPADAVAAALQASLHNATTAKLAIDQAIDALQGDRIATSAQRMAFATAAEHVHTTHRDRARLWAASQPAAPAFSNPPSPAQIDTQRQQAVPLQRRFVTQLERDIIYLDDLLAISRIAALQGLTHDLLANQRELKSLLHRARQEQGANSPALKAELKRAIAELRGKMMEVLNKMGDVKQTLPGEYRNIEASRMARLDETLQRLAQQLDDGDLSAAAQQVEQLANMVDNMAQSLKSAERDFGDDRYAGVRAQLQQFAQALGELDDAEGKLSQKSQDLLAQYHEQTMAHAAPNAKAASALAAQARQLAHAALEQLDAVGAISAVDVNAARQRLFEVQALLAHHDLAEAHHLMPEVNEELEVIAAALAHAREPTGGNDLGDAGGTQGARHARAAQAAHRAGAQAGALTELLDRLFAEPGEVLRASQKQQLRAAAQAQGVLAQRAQGLAQNMQELARQVPVFGEAPQQAIAEAERNMRAAAESLSGRALAEGAAQSLQAKEALGRLRAALQQATQQSDGQGIPLPIGAAPSTGSGSGTGVGQDFGASEQDEVDIPLDTDAKAGAHFRQSVLDAAKQKAPAYYEDAVRRYYNELMR